MFILTLAAFGGERKEVCLKVVDTHYEVLQSMCINPYPANVENMVSS
jgi:hypothetical protein